MRVIIFIFALVLFFNLTGLEAQDMPDLSSFTAVELKSGFPALHTGKKFDFRDPLYGTINSGQAFLGSYILVENSSPDKPKFWFMAVKKDSTFSLSSLSFVYTDSFKTAKINLKNSSNANYTYPLELLYRESENQFYYNWIGSGQDNTPQAVKDNSKLTGGSEIPNFSVQLLNGQTFDLINARDKIVVINWWSTTCGPCIAEIPGLNKLVSKYKSHDNIVFLAIAWDTRQKLNSFLQEYSFDYRQALYNNEIVKLFGGAFPRNLVVNKNSKIAYNETGADKDQWKKIDQVIQMLIKK